MRLATASLRWGYTKPGWVTSACLGQMKLNAEQAGVVAEIFGLSAEE